MDANVSSLRVVRMPEVAEKVALKPSTIYGLVQVGKFPAPFKITPEAARRVGCLVMLRVGCCHARTKGMHMSDQQPKKKLDLNALRLPQNFGENLGVRKVLTHVPVSKPSSDRFFRVHPSIAKQFDAFIYEDKATKDVYWVAAGFDDTLLRWKMKLEVANGHEKEVQPRVQA